MSRKNTPRPSEVAVQMNISVPYNVKEAVEGSLFVNEFDSASAYITSLIKKDLSLE